MTEDRTYYVRNDGSDSNDGLTNSAGGAFLTIQKAVDIIAGTVDSGEFQVTIQVADGTYIAGATFKRTVGSLPPIIRGNTTTPANCLVAPTSGGCVVHSVVAKWHIEGFKFSSAAGASLITVSDGASLTHAFMDFGTTTGSHMLLARSAVVIANSDYTISGSCSRHISASYNSVARVRSRTITITGTPNWSAAFIEYFACSTILFDLNTFSGSANGKRYAGTLSAVLDVSTAPINYLPGGISGTAITGAIYTGS